MSRSRGGWLGSLAVGGGVGVATAAATTLLLGFFPPLGIAVGALVGLGAGMLMSPMAPALLAVSGDAPTPTTVQGSLDAVLGSVQAMDGTMRRLESRPLWSGTNLDERIAKLLFAIRNLANTPALRQRASVDGDVNMLYTLATDYLPTIVNLAIENDRMHVTFSGTGSRSEVEQNVRALEEQVGILGEVVDHIEMNVVRGTSQSVEEHAEFLQMRFAQSGTASVLDLNTPLASDDGAGSPPSASGTPPNSPASP